LSDKGAIWKAVAPNGILSAVQPDAETGFLPELSRTAGFAQRPGFTWSEQHADDWT
jgi:hypothetical protein